MALLSDGVLLHCRLAFHALKWYDHAYGEEQWYMICVVTIAAG